MLARVAALALGASLEAEKKLSRQGRHSRVRIDGLLGGVCRGELEKRKKTMFLTYLSRAICTFVAANFFLG
jgi:hypothetical protein